MLKEFLDEDYRSTLLEQFSKRVPWIYMTWTDHDQPKSVFHYERSICKYEFIDELIEYVETVFETEVFGLWADKYKNGNNFSPKHRKGFDCHYLIINLGGMRKINFKSTYNFPFLIEDGDALYFSDTYNKESEITVPPFSTEEETIQLVFFMNEPYSSSSHQFRYIPGYGEMRI